MQTFILTLSRTPPVKNHFVLNGFPEVREVSLRTTETCQLVFLNYALGLFCRLLHHRVMFTSHVWGRRATCIAVTVNPQSETKTTFSWVFVVVIN